MTNKPKARGTAGESAVVRYLLEHKVLAKREILHGSIDHGDVHVHTKKGLIVLEVNNPQQRFVRLYCAREASGSQFSANYILYGPAGAFTTMPLEQNASGALGVTDASAGIVVVEQHISPAQGTA